MCDPLLVFGLGLAISLIQFQRLVIRLLVPHHLTLVAPVHLLAANRANVETIVTVRLWPMAISGPNGNDFRDLLLVIYRKFQQLFTVLIAQDELQLVRSASRQNLLHQFRKVDDSFIFCRFEIRHIGTLIVSDQVSIFPEIEKITRHGRRTWTRTKGSRHWSGLIFPAPEFDDLSFGVGLKRLVPRAFMIEHLASIALVDQLATVWAVVEMAALVGRRRAVPLARAWRA
jgi:hypothetical protein